MPASIGKLAAKLTIDGQEFSLQLDKAQRDVKRFGEQLDRGAGGGEGGGPGGAALAAATAGGSLLASAAQQGLTGLKDLVTGSFASVDATAKLSDRLGTTTQFVQAMDHAANLAGVSTEEMNTSMERLSRTLGQAQLGSQEAVGALARLGLTQRDVRGLAFDQFVFTVADRIKGLKDPSAQAAVAMGLFGREGLRLTKFLQGGSAAIAGAREEIEALGIAFSRADATKVEQANQAMLKVKEVFEGLGQRAAIEIAPLIAAGGDLFEKWAKTANLKQIVVDTVREVLHAVRDLVKGLKTAADWFGQLHVTAQQLKDDFAILKDPAGSLGKALTGDGASGDGGGWRARHSKDPIDKLFDDLDKGLGHASAAAQAPGGGEGLGALGSQIDALAIKLREQASAYGLAGTKLEVWKLQQAGATDAQLAGVRALDAQITLLDRVTSGAARGANAFEQYRDRLAQLRAAQERDKGLDIAGAVTKLNEELRKADQQKLADIFNNALGPLDKFKAALEDVDRLHLLNGLKGQAQFQAFQQLEQSVGGAQAAQAPAALTKGSKEALGVIAENERRRGGESVQQEVRRVLKRANELHEKQLERMQQVAKVLEEIKKKGGVQAGGL